MSDVNDKQEEGSGAGSVVGFQMPAFIKKEDLAELLKRHNDLDESLVSACFQNLKEDELAAIGKSFEEKKYDEVANTIRDNVLKEFVRSKMREIVRKKPGGGGYVLYAPNPKKKGPAKQVATFPTKLGAKRAELARFPPDDPTRLNKLRAQVSKLLKDPKKRKDYERIATKLGRKKESVDNLKETVSLLVKMTLNEASKSSMWDEQIKKLSSKALHGDKKFQRLQNDVEKKTEQVLHDAYDAINSALRKTAKLKNGGIRKSHDGEDIYLTFGASLGNVMVEPLYIFVKDGIPEVQMSDKAKVALTKAEAKDARIFRAELVMVQEKALDVMDELSKSIEARDKYMDGLSDSVDSFVSKLSALQLSILKRLLVGKYKRQ